MDKLLERIKQHEGFRSRVYQCTEGHDTIGYGSKVSSMELDEDIAEMILKRDVYKKIQEINNKFGWFEDMPHIIQDVVTEMCYQMGVRGFSKFKKTIMYFMTNKWKKASIEMLDSKWAKQTPNRAKELSEIVAHVQ